MDLYFSGASCNHTDGSEEEICAILPVQFRGGVPVRGNDGH